MESRASDLLLETHVKRLEADAVWLRVRGEERRLANDAVFALVGRQAPLAFFRRARIPIVGEMTMRSWLALSTFVAFCVVMYAWKLGWIASGLAWIGQTFFPGQSWWRAYGLILAWPLFFWNLATAQPIWGWLVLSSIQTFVVIPWLVVRWGKGACCGWIRSCGALAETLGWRILGWALPASPVPVREGDRPDAVWARLRAQENPPDV